MIKKVEIKKTVRGFEVYGSQPVHKRLVDVIRDRFQITDNMKRASSFEVYKPRIKKVWLGLAIISLIAGIVTTPIPATGVVLYPLAGYCFGKC